MMTKQQIMGQFHNIKGQLRAKFGEISDDELERAGGSIEQLVGVIQTKTGKARREIEETVNQLFNEGKTMAGQATDAIRDYAGQATGALKDGYESLSSNVREGYGEAEAVVRRNPVESLAIALAAGLAVGVLLGVLMNRSSR